MKIVLDELWLSIPQTKLNVDLSFRDEPFSDGLLPTHFGYFKRSPRLKQRFLVHQEFFLTKPKCAVDNFMTDSKKRC